ncbi:hypothetical protein ACOCEA_03725 [Maribacter sp. CXY002]|uniref:hypothetical protein n=1 Tax=Maribacter luteocoastalis TaxID=3407671 RepID=UPI003B67655A
MPKLFFKVSKFIVLGLLPFFLISSSGKDLYYHSNLHDEDLSLAVWNFDFENIGNNTFETKVGQNHLGSSFSTIELFLDNSYKNQLYNMEFVISREAKARTWLPGTYQVRDINGLLDEFDGVFGVATIDTLGEAPFFAKKGSIDILSINDTHCKGKLDIAMRNTDGYVINITGSFEAKAVNN